MRTNIVLDERLVRQAMKVSGARTKREVVNLALQHMVMDYKGRRARISELVGQDFLDADYDVRKVREGMNRGAR